MDEIIEGEFEEIDSDDLVQSRSDEDILEEAMCRYKKAKNAWEPLIENWTFYTRFAYGDQWDEARRLQRTSKKRSVVTYNKVEEAIRSVVGNAAANPAGIKVHPISGNSNTAKVIDGLIRHIEYESNAKGAYNYALECAVTGGWGAWRVRPKECDDGTFTIAIERIKHPTSLIFDPDSEDIGFTDAQYCFYIRKVPRGQFEKDYPNVNPGKIDPKISDWYDKESVQIAEYWVKDGSKVNQYIITGDLILSKNEDYPGKYIPFIFCPGKEIEIEDQREFRGMVNNVVDMQRILNYAKSEQADLLSGNHKSQWLVEASMIAGDGMQRMWNNANNSNLPYLVYNSKDGNRPIQIDPPPPPAALITAAQEADNDIRAALGIREPLKDIPATQSGKAIALQIQQSNIGSFLFIDNHNTAIKRTGTIIIDLIPHIYTGPQVINIMGADDQITATKVNQAYVENGEQVMHDLTSGKYSCTISVGPSYESQRSENKDRIKELVTAYPQLMQLAGDLVVKNLDFNDSEELALRLRAGIPPQVLAASSPSNGDKSSQLQNLGMQLQQMQLQMQQSQQMMQQMQQENAQLKQQLNDKSMDYQLKDKEIQARIQIAMMNNQAKSQLQQQEAENDSDLLAQKASHDIITGVHSASIKHVESIGNVGMI